MKKNYIFTLLITLCLTGASFGQDLLITGAIDGPLPGGFPKGIELYAINAITDLSIYGIESAGNGIASSGTQEYTFPGDAIAAGTYIYLISTGTNNITLFTQYLGVTPQYENNVVNINGDDTVILYKNGSIEDSIGVIGEDGTGKDWEHLDGWAYRNSGVAPNAVFDSSEWTFSGKNALDGCDKSDDTGTNAECDSVFPIGTYTYGGTASVKNNAIAGFSTYPNPITNNTFTLTSTSNEEKSVMVFNLLGKKVLDTRFSGTKSEINVAAIHAGIYILKVTEAGKTATKKLVIK